MKDSRNRDIEVLRAIAVTLVLVHHLNMLFIWDGSWQVVRTDGAFWGGVDLFFCISGFVITRSFVRSGWSPPRFLDLSLPFWVRRVYRLWPAALAWLFVVLIGSMTFNRSGAFGAPVSNMRDLIAGALQVANAHFMLCHNYGIGKCGANVVYWSLSLEEQFYLLFPMLLYFGRDRKWVLLALGAVVVVQLGLPREKYSPLWWFRSDALALGCILGLTLESALYQRLKPSLLRHAALSLPTLVVVIALTAMVGSVHNPLPFATGLLAITSAIAVFIASFDEDYILPESRLKSLLVAVGARSYALYLVHPPAAYTTREIFTRLLPGRTFDASFTVPFLLVGGALLFLYAELTHRFIEQPFLKIGRERARAIITAREALPAPGTPWAPTP